MSTEHTPGPWHVTADYCGALAVNDHLQFPSEFPVALIGGPLADKRANARLIAAAPDLLAALERVENRLTMAARAFYGAGRAKDLRAALDNWIADAETARAAIAKAKGGE